jgi:hypothetical protein
VEDEKEMKRKAKQDKLESQKAAGTYMTKAEKEKAKKLQERLESMKAAGMLPGAVTGLQDGASVAIEAGKTSSLYSNKKKPPANNQKQAIVDTKPAEPEEVPVVVAPVVQAKVVDAVAENWDDDDGEDDWESSTNIERISTIVEAKAAQLADDVEDTLVLENRIKFEELKLLGIERAKRDEETRLRRYGACCVLCSIYRVAAHTHTSQNICQISSHHGITIKICFVDIIVTMSATVTLQGNRGTCPRGNGTKRKRGGHS